MRYNRDLACGRLLDVAAPLPAPYEIRSSRLAGWSSNPTPEHIFQAGLDEADPGRLDTIRPNQRTVNSSTFREADKVQTGRRRTSAFVFAERSGTLAAAKRQS